MAKAILGDAGACMEHWSEERPNCESSAMLPGC